MAIRHETLESLCKMLDDPERGIKDKANRQDILHVVLCEIIHASQRNPIEYYKKIVYGNERGYVVDHKTAQAICTISGKTTLDNSTMKGLEMLGFTFKEVLPPKK